MILRRLSLTQFKNYRQSVFEPIADINLICGANGMGKTNLIDAIYYLALTKSYFSLRDAQLIREKDGFFRLDGLFAEEDEVCRVVAKYNGQEKVLEWEGSPYEKLSDHIGRIPVVFVVPDDVWILNEGSEERRRFLDMTISQYQPSYLRHLMAYNRYLKHKLSLLKASQYGKTLDYTVLEACNQGLATHAQPIYEARKSCLQELEPLFQEMYRCIAQVEEDVVLAYQSSLAQRELSLTLHEQMDEEVRQRRALYGIHRDDLVFKLKDHSIRKFASQGQRKTFILALKLAQHRILEQQLHKKPILLLDDIFDKLDPSRVRGILQTLHERIGGQVFITDTQAHRVLEILAESGIPAASFEIRSGTIITNPE